MSKATYEKYLEENGQLTYKNVGVSMLPLLKRGRDLFTLNRKTAERCKKYDVVLYRRPPNKYVLHRIVEVRENDYVIRGDNCINNEYGITDEDILGVMTSFVHKGKEYSVNDFRYKVYYVLRCKLYFFRLLKFKLKRLLKGLIKK